MNKEKKHDLSQAEGLIPELRFPESLKKGEWVMKSLDKVVNDFIVPMRDKPKKLDGEIPWCRIEDFDGMYLSSSKSNQGVSAETVEEMNLKVYPVNTLLVSCSADLGRCAITQKKIVTNQTFIGLVPNTDKVDTVYLYYLMTNSRNELNARSSGTTISYLSRQEFEKFKIGLPKRQEQQKIASCLSSLDELIAAHNDKLETLKDHKKGLMQNLFPQKGEKVPRFRFPEFEKDGEWIETSLNKISPSIFDGTHQTPKYTDKGIPFYSVENIVSGNKNKFISRNVYLYETRNNKPEFGDILITRIGSIGVSKVVDWKYEFGIYVTLAVIKSSKKFNSHYLSSYIQSSRFQKEIYRRSLLKAAPQKINMNELRECEVLLPSKYKEQEKIASCFKAINELIKAQTDKIGQLQQHKKGLMQGLFPKIDN